VGAFFTPSSFNLSPFRPSVKISAISLLLIGLLVDVQAQSVSPLVLEKSIPLPGISGGFNHHAADGQHHRVFVCASGNKSVEVVDLASGKIVKSLAGEKPAATCFIPELNLLAVSRGNTIQLYDARSFEVTSTLSFPGSVDELRYDAPTKQLLAGCMTAPNEGIAVIDLVGRKVLTLIKATHPQGFGVETGGARIFVSTPRAGEISVLDRTSARMTAEWKLTDAAANYPVDLDPTNHRLFVGCRRPTRLVVLDTTKGTEVARTEIGADTDDLAWDAANQRIYVACGEGVISVVQQDDADHYRTVAKIASAPEARNSVWVPETGEFCVTAPAHDGQPAALLVYRAQPRHR
jgi:DNA-binding beta-propeller fold protein YncE